MTGTKTRTITLIKCYCCEEGIDIYDDDTYVIIGMKHKSVSTIPIHFHLACFEAMAGSDLINNMLPRSKAPQYSGIQAQIAEKDHQQDAFLRVIKAAKELGAALRKQYKIPDSKHD